MKGEKQREGESGRKEERKSIIELGILNFRTG